MEKTEQTKPHVGISTCLLGFKVRFDGGHKLDHFLADTLGQFVQWVPVCPEMEAGFGVPREAFRLVGEVESPRLVTNRTEKDVTDRMLAWTRKRLDELAGESLCGFVFKAKSPSSGMERVKVYNEKGVPLKQGVGVFARAFMERFPNLPVEEEGRLHDMVLRENFIVRVFAYSRWREWLQNNPSLGGLVDFHSRHKLLFMAHQPGQATELGGLVARASQHALDEVLTEYEERFMALLHRRATHRTHTNVLHHVMGYFKKELAGEEKAELLEVIENYRRGLLPLVVPLTLMNHYQRMHPHPYLERQVYLDPGPLELQLRNHV
ncbi:MAG: DUF523 and DUF1722 domain-containing protein [Acidobacteriota bacterium]|jgi:uncharacterized protein YbgA (DUF1722 family)/uncharacterized protein YbbK (DUF523 family)|nr:DUF523 and DUF1722 domain-containing protein [Acidobacteriota bacterium]